MVSLSKKADFSLVDTLRESLQRKVDTETLATMASKIKAES
jgi:predicted ATP-grasp superfamily ATP-dependent carboligase